MSLESSYEEKTYFSNHYGRYDRKEDHKSKFSKKLFPVNFVNKIKGILRNFEIADNTGFYMTIDEDEKDYFYRVLENASKTINEFYLKHVIFCYCIPKENCDLFKSFFIYDFCGIHSKNDELKLLRQCTSKQSSQYFELKGKATSSIMKEICEDLEDIIFTIDYKDFYEPLYDMIILFIVSEIYKYGKVNLFTWFCTNVDYFPKNIYTIAQHMRYDLMHQYDLYFDKDNYSFLYSDSRKNIYLVSPLSSFHSTRCQKYAKSIPQLEIFYLFVKYIKKVETRKQLNNVITPIKEKKFNSK